MLKRKILSLVLIIAIIVSLFPASSAWAEESVSQTQPQVANRTVTLSADELADYYGIREDGSIFEAVKFGCTSFIDCSDVESIRLTMVNTQTSYKWGLAFYDANKQFLTFVEQGNTAADLQSMEKTIPVPENAAYFRTTYYNFQNRKATGHEFSCVLTYEAGYEPGRYRNYQDGHIYFSREVNQSLPGEAPEYKRTTGVLALPENYDPNGEATKLIVYFHGYSHGVYMDHWGSTETFVQQKQHFLERGYAVLDCNGARDNNKQAGASNSSAASRQYVDGFWQCVQYALENYNLDDQLYVVGGSAGGPSAINFADWHGDNVRALMLLAPWTDLEVQCWGQGIREPFVEYLGFANTTDYEVEKTLEVDPALRIQHKEDGTAYIDSLDLPVRAFVGANDTVVSMHTSLNAFMDALQVCRPDAQLVTWEGMGHEIVSGAIAEVDSAVCDFFDEIAAKYEPVWEVGTIASANGQNNTDKTRLRTKDYLLLSDYVGVGINAGYTMTNFVYDANKNYLGTSSWLGRGQSFTTADLLKKYPDGVYFRIALRSMDSKTLTEQDVAASGVKFYAPGQAVPVPESDIKFENVASIGAWQDGAIFDGKLFALGGNGTGGVFDVATGQKLSTLTLDKADVLKPHANSVCFGSTYYAEGDQYPLLYVNIYNNYKDAADRMEGTCCVYRLTETEGAFTTQLVQVIRIGFTEDLTLWKSKEGSGDVRPYGNFVVDTDSGKLYAYTMRDANKTTRFFRFAIPAIGAGTYSEAYGCNVVTLNAGDIESQFDTAYFNYLQGVTYYDGKIISVEGFKPDPAVRIVDLKSQTLTATYYPGEAGLTAEAEVICVDTDTGILYYAAADGMLRMLILPNPQLESILSGKNVSILGDSISTFKGVTDNGERNSTITSEYLARYALATDPDASLVKLNSVDDTWWMQTINRYGMNLLVNNSWRGTKVLDTGIRSGYGIRSQNLHDDTLADNPGGAVIDPDIIAIHLGTNDYLQSVTPGTFDPAAMTYIRSDGYDTPVNFAQAYAIMVHKILQRYPNADVFCFTLSPITYKTDKAALESLNDIIRAVAEHFGLPIVDLYTDSGITADNAATYLAADKIHPNQAGIDLITACFNRALAAHYAPKAYQWKPNGSALESLVADGFTANDATMTQGSITDGAFSDTRFTLEKTVQLLHDKEWSVEWRSTGGWSTATGYSGALLLSQTASSMTADSCYLYRRGGNSFIALGIYQNGSHHNYGVSLSGIDSSVAHTYKLVNRIAPDGSNMVYLFVDGVEIGALNQYYIGGNLQSEASNWISGKDFSFSYMGTAEHPISGCSIEYIRVNEGLVLTLQHSPVAIPGVEATLTKDGLTEGQRCSVCGEILVYQQVVPSMGMALLRELLSGKKLSILGDSISTYNGWTNSNTVNSTLGPSHAVYYYGNNGVGLDDTWWKQVSDQVGLEILVNNAWGGSSVTSVRTDHGLLSYGWNVRPERLHDDTLDNNPGGLPINPDIIAVYMGTNDHTRNVTCNTVFDDDYWAMIEAEGFVPPATTDFDQSCALMIYKICQNYPDADVFILNNPTMSSGTEENRLAYNAAFQAIAAHYGCTVVDLHSTELSNYNTYTIDGRHPNAAGMDIMTEAFIKALIERYVNHTHTPVTDPAVAPTCTETGLTEGSHCSVCGEVIVAQEVMPALGHSLTMKQQNATHYWYKCQRCDVVSEKTAHSGLEKKPMLQYFAIPNNSRACESIVVYLPRENGYLRINFEHMISPNMNYNVWINYLMQACDDNLNHRFWLTNGGAVEAAIRMDGRDDFSGGVAHGDEIDTEFYLEVDGVRVSFAALTELTTFTELKIIRHSTLYDPADHTTEIATHDTEYLLTKDGMKLSQKVKWLVEADCSSSYMAMFPVLRTTTDAAGNPIYISEFFYNDINSTHFDVRESGKKEYPQQWNPGVTKMTLYSNTMGLTHTLEILEMTAVPGSGYGNCSGSESYNKLYFSITGFGEGAAYVAKPGDEWIVVSFLNVEIGQENRCYYGHTAVTDAAVAPACTTPGLTEGSHCSVCNEILVAQTEVAALGHDEVHHDAKAPTATEVGWEAYVTCSRCDYTTYVEIPALEYVMGDLDGNGTVTKDDAIYLLMHTLFGSGSYPVNQDADYNGDGVVNKDDAIYLLMHTLFGSSQYPLNLEGEENEENFNCNSRCTAIGALRNSCLCRRCDCEYEQRNR